MNKTIVVFSALIATVFPSIANTYTGTISGIVTYADPGNLLGLGVGDTINGTYEYDASGIDGTFYGYSQHGTGRDGTLDGVFGLGFRDPDNWESLMTVSGGVVTDVDVNGQVGSWEWWINENTFRFKRNVSISEEAWVNGDLSFSAASPVPDGGSTGSFLAGTLFLGWCLRNRLRR